jgi:hypothetical protein
MASTEVMRAGVRVAVYSPLVGSVIKFIGEKGDENESCLLRRCDLEKK